MLEGEFFFMEGGAIILLSDCCNKASEATMDRQQENMKH